MLFVCLTDIGGGHGVGSLGLMTQHSGSGRIRACTESVLVNLLMHTMSTQLQEENLYRAFTEVGCKD